MVYTYNIFDSYYIYFCGFCDKQCKICLDRGKATESKHAEMIAKTNGNKAPNNTKTYGRSVSVPVSQHDHGKCLQPINITLRPTSLPGADGTAYNEKNKEDTNTPTGSPSQTPEIDGKDTAGTSIGSDGVHIGMPNLGSLGVGAHNDIEDVPDMEVVKTNSFLSSAGVHSDDGLTSPSAGYVDGDPSRSDLRGVNVQRERMEDRGNERKLKLNWENNEMVWRRIMRWG